MTAFNKTTVIAQGKNKSNLASSIDVHIIDAIVRLFETRPVQILLIYFIGHIVFRSLLPISIGFDEGEQFIVTQMFALGYSSQPPLYDWLQLLFFNVFGVNSFAMILLKQSILLAIFLTVYAIWRKTGLSVALASGCMFSSFLLTEVGWELQRTRTHLSLAVLMAALFALISLTVFRSRENQSTRIRTAMLYSALGVVVGMGLLAKYNFIVLPMGLAFAALFKPKFRKSVLSPWILLTLASATVVFLPHGLWIFENLDFVNLESDSKFGLELSSGFVSTRLHSVWAIVVATFQFYLQAIIILAILLLDWRDWKYSSTKVINDLDETTRRNVDWIGLGCAMAFGVIFLIVVSFEITVVRNRWLVPAGFLSVAPVLLRTRVFYGPNVKRIYWLVVLTILVIGSIVMAKNCLEVSSQKGSSADLPALAGPIWEDALEASDQLVVIIDDQRVAGLIRMQYPSVRIVAPNYMSPVINLNDRIIVIAETENGEFPDEIRELINEQFPAKILGPLSRLNATGTAPEDETPWNIARLETNAEFEIGNAESLSPSQRQGAKRKSE